MDFQPPSPGGCSVLMRGRSNDLRSVKTDTPTLGVALTGIADNQRQRIKIFQVGDFFVMVIFILDFKNRYLNIMVSSVRMGHELYKIPRVTLQLGQ